MLWAGVSAHRVVTSRGARRTPTGEVATRCRPSLADAWEMRGEVAGLSSEALAIAAVGMCATMRAATTSPAATMIAARTVDRLKRGVVLSITVFSFSVSMSAALGLRPNG